MRVFDIFKTKNRVKICGELGFRRVSARGDEKFIAGAEFDPVYGPRIETLLEAHGAESPAVDCWCVTRGNEPVGAIARFYGTVYIVLKPSLASPEHAKSVRGFLDTNHKWYGVEGAEPFLSALADEYAPSERERAPWMYLPRSAEIPAVSLGNDLAVVDAAARLRDMYDVIGACHKGFLDSSDYDLWADDYEARLSRGVMETYLLLRDGVPVSCASVNAVGRKYAILGSVSTIPAARGSGYGRLICAVCAARIRALDKIPVLQCGEPELAAFYRPMGYVIGGDWGSFETGY